MKTNNTNNADKIEFSVDGQKQSASRTWFRGEHTNFNPATINLLPADSVLKYVLHGWTPKNPVIGKNTNVVAFGSCFAANITNWLARRNYSVLTNKEGEYADSYVVRFGEGMVNSFVIRQQFEWAFEGKVFDSELWHGYDAKSFGYDENVRIKTHDIFSKADVFIITLGLSEIWYDEITGGVFWRAIPKDNYDPSRHKFRVSSVDENKENITEIIRIIRKHRPNAKVILTLSPIPLVATFRPVSCITANSASKAILRAAVDEVLREINEPENIFYWPSYEIVMDIFSERWMKDRRHVKKQILDFIMTIFESVWCTGDSTEMSICEAWIHARCSTGSLQPILAKLLRGKNEQGIIKILTRLEKTDEGIPDIQLILERIQEIVAVKPKHPFAGILQQYSRYNTDAPLTQS